MDLMGTLSEMNQRSAITVWCHLQVQSKNETEMDSQRKQTRDCWEVGGWGMGILGQLLLESHPRLAGILYHHPHLHSIMMWSQIQVLLVQTALVPSSSQVIPSCDWGPGSSSPHFFHPWNPESDPDPILTPEAKAKSRRGLGLGLTPRSSASCLFAISFQFHLCQSVLVPM